MTPTDLIVAAAGLLVAVAVGTLVHELSHAVALRVFGVPYRIELLPSAGRRGPPRAGSSGALASVTPVELPEGLAPWRLRVAALAPLALAAPFALVPLGILPDPIATGSPSLQAATVGWLACALPSPQDFSLVAHADEAMAAHADEATTADADEATTPHDAERGPGT